jgi:hypothetical protein
MLPPVTVRLGVVVEVDPAKVLVSFGGGDPVEAVTVGEPPGLGTQTLCLSTYDRVFALGTVARPVDDTPMLPPLSPRADNALVVDPDGSLRVPGWARWGSTVVTVDANKRATITHDYMPDMFTLTNGTYMVQLGDRHQLNPGHVLPMTAGRTRVSFQVEVPGAAAGMVIRLNWLVLAERKQ